MRREELFHLPASNLSHRDAMGQGRKLLKFCLPALSPIAGLRVISGRPVAPRFGLSVVTLRETQFRLNVDRNSPEYVPVGL